MARPPIRATMALPARFSRNPPVNLQPRKPELPAAAGLAHPVDRLLQPYFAAHGVAPGAPVPDRLFARRVFLDVIGLLPTTGLTLPLISYGRSNILLSLLITGILVNIGSIRERVVGERATDPLAVRR